jgi:ribosomal protein S18 acetylase RimI-like enzyme
MDRNSIQIKQISIDSLQELRAMSIKTFYDSFIYANSEENMQHYISNFFSEEKLAAELLNNDSKFFFAVMNNIPVGYLKINVGNAQTELQDGHGIEIERIYVLKDQQGKNIGQHLFYQAMKTGEELGADYLWLGVWEKNPGAIRFYERNGLVKYASHPFKLGDDLQTDIMMKLDLKNKL